MVRGTPTKAMPSKPAELRSVSRCRSVGLSRNAVTWVHRPFTPANSGLMVVQNSRTSIFGFISIGRSSSSSIIPGIITCRIRPSRPASAEQRSTLCASSSACSRPLSTFGAHELERDGVESHRNAPTDPDQVKRPSARRVGDDHIHICREPSPYRPGPVALRSLGDVSVAPDLDDRFARELPELAVRWQAEAAPEPRLLVLNEPLATQLGIEPGWLRGHEGAAFSDRQPGSRGCGARGPGLCRTPVRRLCSASGRRPSTVAGRTGDGRWRPSRPSPQGFGRNAVRAGRRRSCGGRADASRIHHQRGHARAWHPDHAVAGGGRHGAHRATRDAAAGRGAGPYREQPPAGRHLPVRGSRRRRGPATAAGRLRHRPPLPGCGRRRQSLSRAVRRRGFRAGGADRTDGCSSGSCTE